MKSRLAFCPTSALIQPLPTKFHKNRVMSVLPPPAKPELSVSAQIVALPRLSMAEIWALWDRYYKVRPQFPNRKYLEARIAYRIQEEAFGGLPDATRRRLEAIGSGLSKCKVRTHMPKATYELTPGTRLIKNWGGRQHEVLVNAVGDFVYMGQSYKSLTAIANHITGTRWSGLLFFGLKNKMPAAEEE